MCWLVLQLLNDNNAIMQQMWLLPVILEEMILYAKLTKMHGFFTLSSRFFSHPVTTHDWYCEGLYLSSRPVRLQNCHTATWCQCALRVETICGQITSHFFHLFYVVMGDSSSVNQCCSKANDYIVHIKLFMCGVNTSDLKLTVELVHADEACVLCLWMFADAAG